MERNWFSRRSFHIW